MMIWWLKILLLTQKILNLFGFEGSYILKTVKCRRCTLPLVFGAFTFFYIPDESKSVPLFNRV